VFLEKDEIRRLTGRSTRRTQKQVLDAMGIHYKENGIGELVISKRHVERVLGGEAVEVHHQVHGSHSAMPDFSAIGG